MLFQVDRPQVRIASLYIVAASTSMHRESRNVELMAASEPEMYKNCFMAWLSPLAGVLLLSNLNIFEQVFGRRRESTPRFKPLFVACAPASMGKKQGKIFTEFSRTVSYLSDISPFSTTFLFVFPTFSVSYGDVQCGPVSFLPVCSFFPRLPGAGL